MYTTDRDAFEQVLTKLATAFPKDLTDDLRAVYWEALKDLPIETVRRMADQRAKYGKFFPKPSELRPADDKPKGEPKMDASFREAERLCIANLEELRARDPAAHRREVAKRRIARLEVVGDRSSVTYAEEMRQLRAIAYG